MPNPKNSEFIVDAARLESQIRKLADKKKTISETTGKLRAFLKDILTKDGYHPKAMAIIRDIDAMSETQMADFMRTFKPMFEAMYSEFWELFIGKDLLAGVENVVPIEDAKK